jgi:interleukin-1 receptor-associated kinase 1/coatomer subunit beta'
MYSPGFPKEILINDVHQGQGSDGQELAVKVIKSSVGVSLENFDRFKRVHAKVKHPNIIQLLGYCYEIRKELVMDGGKHVHARKVFVALCFEYMHNGSLHDNLCGAMLLYIM